MKTATSQLSTVSGEVIDSKDQYEVFNDPRAVSETAYDMLRVVCLQNVFRTQSDPTHSFLSKDHFVSRLIFV